MQLQEMAREMERTTFVKKVITDVPAREVLERAQEYFKERGYRARPSGTPNTVQVRGGAEGTLPSVIGEIGVRTTNRGRTIVSFSGYGERLSQQLREFHDLMRAMRTSTAARPAAPAEARAPESRAEMLEEDALVAAAEAGADAAAQARERELFEQSEQSARSRQGGQGHGD
jgi:hypothetical protein